MANTRLSNASGFTANKHNSLLTGSQSGAINNVGMNGFEAIATATPSGTNSVVFTSIPAGYQALQLRMIVRVAEVGSTNTGHFIRLNGSSASIYDIARLRSAFPATTADSSPNSSSWSIPCATGAGSSSGLFGAGILNIYNYANPTLFTNASFYGGNDSYSASTDVSMIFNAQFLWKARDVVSQIELFQTSNFISGTRFSLYGVK